MADTVFRKRRRMVRSLARGVPGGNGLVDERLVVLCDRPFAVNPDSSSCPLP
jgi:hypothetical protein